MYFKKLFAISGVLLLALFTGCSTPVSDHDIFDGENITIEFLKEKDCLFYENLVFAKDDKNHVFVTDEDKIVEHYTYSEVEFDEENFDRVSDKTMVEAVEYIGLPSFVGLSSDLSLDYSCRDGFIRRLKLSKNNDELLINSVEVLDKEDVNTWFDQEKTDLPGPEQCQQIAVGMSLDEVVRKIGKPQRDVGYGVILFEFDIDNGSVLTVEFALDVAKEDAYVHGDPSASVYGTHNLYVANCRIR